MLRLVTDMDGTVSLADHRQHFLDKQPRDWDGFHAASVDDPPNWPVIEMLRSLHHAGHHVEIWTGRVEAMRMQTVEWLARYDVPYQALMMRPNGDYSSGTDMKFQWMMERGQPDLMIDDSAPAVARFREAGILVLDVAGHPY